MFGSTSACAAEINVVVNDAASKETSTRRINEDDDVVLAVDESPLPKFDELKVVIIIFAFQILLLPIL